ncbi:MAG: NAD-dependent epimerase/dehydratase family protein [Proteobacteria bacterium]|nr:NAD-dependent epimerase/dehydratase family protein [Pseudomonadota bacterium]
MEKRILITGATGFVGGGILRRLVSDGRLVRAAIRKPVYNWPEAVETVPVGDMDADTDWREALRDVDCVVHCAARTHVLKEVASDPLAEFRRVNEFGTLALARQAAQAGVRRFIFLSSIGVNGNETFDQPFSVDTPPRLGSAYAIAKLGAETGLRQLATETPMEIVILRPPLVYGPDAPGNFRQLKKAIQHRLPLPLGSIRNRRSFVALDNLVDLVLTCLDHPAAAGQTFLVSDNEDVSTTEFVRRLAKAMNKSTVLLPIPAAALNALARLVGKEEQARKLTGSLQVDIRHTMETLQWRPVVSVDAALAAAVTSPCKD